MPERSRVLRIAGISGVFAAAAVAGFALAVGAAARQTARPAPTDTFTIPSAGRTTTTAPASSTQPAWCRAAAAQPATGATVRAFQVWTTGSVQNRPTGSAVFTVPKTWRVVQIGTYHWNAGKGATPPGRLGIKEIATGKVCGWKAIGLPGAGGVPNAYWAVNLSITLPPGRYQIVDSDWSTWAQNAETHHLGIEWVSAPS